MVECLPSIHEALSLVPSTAKWKKTEQSYVSSFEPLIKYPIPTALEEMAASEFLIL